MKLLTVLLAVSLAAGLCACSSSSHAGPAANGPAGRQFFARARPLLPGLPDSRLTDLAQAVCDQFRVNRDGGDVTENQVRRAAPLPVTAPAANDFMQAAVLWRCPRIYDPEDFVHPHKYDH